MQRRKFCALVLCTILVAPGLSGCAEGSGGSERRVISATESQINAHPPENLKNGGTLRLPLSNFPQQWNYYHTNGDSADARLVESALLPRAFYFDVDGKSTPSKDYFEDITLSVDDDVQTVTYKIHAKAHWSNGEPVTWRDLEATWKAANQSNPSFQARSLPGWKNIKSVSQGDSEREAIVRFEEKFSDWQSLFSPFYPASLYQHPQQFNTNWNNSIPMTSGPFKLQKMDAEAQVITIIRDDSWWSERPKLDSISFSGLSGDSDIDAYLSQNLDFVETYGEVERYSRLQDAEDTDFRTAASASYHYLAFNSKGILEDGAIRRALTKAINRQALFDAQYRGIPYAAQPLNNHFFLTSDPRYQDNTKDIAGYNTAKARRELDEAGWAADGDNVRSKDGQKLELRFVVPESEATYRDLAELIKEQLEVAAVTIEIVVVADAEFLPQYIYTRNFDIALLHYTNTGYTSNLYGMFETNSPTQNYGNISSDEITDRLKAAGEILDQKQLTESVNETDKKVWEEGHSLPLSQLPKINAVRPALANYGAAVGFVDTNWSKVGWLRDDLVKP